MDYGNSWAAVEFQPQGWREKRKHGLEESARTEAATGLSGRNLPLCTCKVHYQGFLKRYPECVLLEYSF